MNILRNFKAFFFVFIVLVSDVPGSGPNLPDQGWFSESRTSIVRLTLKVRKREKKVFLKYLKYSFNTFKNLPLFEVQSPGFGFFGQNRILIPGFLGQRWI